jgi:hypothetical protein
MGPSWCAMAPWPLPIGEIWHQKKTHQISRLGLDNDDHMSSLVQAYKAQIASGDILFKYWGWTTSQELLSAGLAGTTLVSMRRVSTAIAPIGTVVYIELYVERYVLYVGFDSLIFRFLVFRTDEVGHLVCWSVQNPNFDFWFFGVFFRTDEIPSGMLKRARERKSMQELAKMRE